MAQPALIKNIQFQYRQDLVPQVQSELFPDTELKPEQQPTKDR